MGPPELAKLAHQMVKVAFEDVWPAKTDWKALSQRIGHADVAFTMKQYVQTDLEADRQVANTLAELIIGGALASTVISDQSHEDQSATVGGDSGEAA